MVTSKFLRFQTQPQKNAMKTITFTGSIVITHGCGKGIQNMSLHIDKTA
jgi:hypothetical protein